MTFCKNSIRISCQIIFVNKHWPQSCLCPFNMSITYDRNESKINPSYSMPSALIKAAYNDYFSISHFTDSLTALAKEIQYRVTCAPLLPPCYFPIIHIEYHIRVVRRQRRSPAGNNLNRSHSWSFSKVGQFSRSMSRGQTLLYHVKIFVTKNTHVQYESPISSGKKVMAKVKVFQK